MNTRQGIDENVKYIQYTIFKSRYCVRLLFESLLLLLLYLLPISPIPCVTGIDIIPSLKNSSKEKRCPTMHILGKLLFL